MVYVENSQGFLRKGASNDSGVVDDDNIFLAISVVLLRKL